MLKYCGAALCALAAILILRSQKSEFSGFISLAASVILLGAACTSFFPVMEFVTESVADTGFSEYLGTLMKALGITLLIQLCSELCRDAGEAALASKLELVGKAEILLLCLPLVSELIALAGEMMRI